MATDSSEEPPALARAISPALLLVLVVGNVLGAGIYVVTGEVAEEMGALAWLAFAVAFGVAAVSALSLCELVTKYPGAAGVTIYVDRAFGRPILSFVVGLAILASGLTSAATAARAFAGDYLAELATVNVTVAAAAFVITLTFINYWGVLASVRLNVLMTLVEVGGLIFVVVAAASILGSGDGDIARPVTESGGDAVVPLALLSGAAIAFFSFLGFEDVANLSEEVQRPRLSYPLALFGGLAITTVLYIVVVYLATAAVAPDRLSESSGPLLVVVEDSPLELSAAAFALIALIAVANTALANLVMGSRLLYGMAQRGLMPTRLRAVDSRHSTPWLAVLVTGIAAFALSASGDLGGLARTTVLLLLSVLVLMNASAIRLRRDPVAHDHFRAPVWAPWLGTLACATLIANQVVRGSPVDLVRALLIVGAGLVAYLLTLRRHTGPRSADLPQRGSGGPTTGGAKPTDANQANATKTDH